MSKPNVLIIHVDQQRADSLRQYGNRQVITPNIDAFAQDAVVYQHHYCSYPVCTPSRYSLLTGKYTSQHLGWNNHCTIPAALPTFPRYLKQAGYQTAAVGKMHMTPTYLDVGFDTMKLAEQDGPGRFDDDYHHDLKARGLIDDIDIIDQRREYRVHASQEYFDSFGAHESDLPEEFHSTTWIGDRAVEEVEKWDADRPHLLMAGFIKPHHPMDPSGRFLRMYDGVDIEPLFGYTESVPERDYSFSRGYFDNAKLDAETLKNSTKHYYATITQIDWQVGRILRLLREKGLYDNTMIIYTSDHGDYLGFHHMLLKGNRFYEPLMRVPLMIKYPKGTDTSGLDASALSDNTQMANHVLSCCGMETDKTMNCCPIGKEREYVFSQTQHAGCSYMVRSGRFKLMVYGKKERLFFDMENDPMELSDLSADPAYAEEFRRHWDALCDAFLFDFSTKIHLDEHAPIIQGKTHPTAETRQEMIDYFKLTSSVGSLVDEDMK